MAVSELGTNAVCHAHDCCRLRLTFGEYGVTVEIDDTSRHRLRQHAPDSERGGGHGMLLDHALARRPHTVCRRHGDKTVRTILAIPSRAFARRETHGGAAGQAGR
ncbi:ATP-binding protein [Actinacidiphila sp. SB3-2]